LIATRRQGLTPRVHARPPYTLRFGRGRFPQHSPPCSVFQERQCQLTEERSCVLIIMIIPFIVKGAHNSRSDCVSLRVAPGTARSIPFVEAVRLLYNQVRETQRVFSPLNAHLSPYTHALVGPEIITSVTQPHAHRHASSALLVPRPDAGDHILPHLFLLFPSYTINLLRNLILRILLRRNDNQLNPIPSVALDARDSPSPDPLQPQSAPPPPPRAHSPSPDAAASSRPDPPCSSVSWAGLRVGSGAVGGGIRSRLWRLCGGVFERRGLWCLSTGEGLRVLLCEER
jgi:hypothetical protein